MVESTTTVVLAGLCVAFVSGAVGKYIGGNGKITGAHCNERRNACQGLILEKVGNLEKKVEALTKAVNEKLLGI